MLFCLCTPAYAWVVQCIHVYMYACILLLICTLTCICACERIFVYIHAHVYVYKFKNGFSHRVQDIIVEYHCHNIIEYMKYYHSTYSGHSPLWHQ